MLQWSDWAQEAVHAIGNGAPLPSNPNVLLSLESKFRDELRITLALPVPDFNKPLPNVPHGLPNDPHQTREALRQLAFAFVDAVTEFRGANLGLPLLAAYKQKVGLMRRALQELSKGCELLIQYSPQADLSRVFTFQYVEINDTYLPLVSQIDIAIDDKKRDIERATKVRAGHLRAIGVNLQTLLLAEQKSLQQAAQRAEELGASLRKRKEELDKHNENITAREKHVQDQETSLGETESAMDDAQRTLDDINSRFEASSNRVERYQREMNMPFTCPNGHNRPEDCQLEDIKRRWFADRAVASHNWQEEKKSLNRLTDERNQKGHQLDALRSRARELKEEIDAENSQLEKDRRAYKEASGIFVNDLLKATWEEHRERTTMYFRESRSNIDQVATAMQPLM